MMSHRKRFYLTLLAISALALILRAVVCCQLADTPEVASPNPQTDMATYIRLAHDCQNGILPDHFDYQPFYYTVFLPLLLPRAAGTGFLLLAAQALAGTAAVALAGLCAAQIFGRRCAWTAALLLALSRFHIFYTPFALYEVLQSFWTALLLFFALKALRHNRWRDWLPAAAVLAAAILTRGNALLFLPVILAAAVIRNRTRLKRASAIAAAVIAIAWLPQLPYALRNYHFAGHWTGPSTAGPKVLALGNTPEAPAAGLAYPLSYSKWVQMNDEGTRSITASIIDFALHQPGAYLELKFRTLIHFWDGDEVPNNVSIDAHGIPHSSLLGTPVLIDFALISALALAGFALALRRRSRSRQLLIAFVLAFCAATVAFYMLARFRIAILPLLCVLAAGTVSYLDRLVRQRRTLPPERLRKSVLTAVIALAAGLFIAKGLLPLYQLGYESTLHAAFSPDGICAHFPGDTTLIHDHGPVPLGVGSTFTYAVPDGGITLQKTFVLPPPPLGQSLVGKPFSARLMFYPQTCQRPGDVVIRHNSQSAHASPTKLYAFSHFLEARFDRLQPDEQGRITVSFTFPPHLANALIPFDATRDYGRNALLSPASPTPLPALAAEPFAEIQFDHTEK